MLIIRIQIQGQFRSASLGQVQAYKLVYMIFVLDRLLFIYIMFVLYHRGDYFMVLTFH